MGVIEIKSLWLLLYHHEEKIPLLASASPSFLVTTRKFLDNATDIFVKKQNIFIDNILLTVCTLYDYMKNNLLKKIFL